MGAGVGSPGGRSWPARSRRHRPCTTADLILVDATGARPRAVAPMVAGKIVHLIEAARIRE
jgi:hypothetical protein